ncbi:MAG: translation elongation factor Ts [Bacteroidales bacterium]|jgi:elongation factor Ts|nr:translation elongation factor Ts [Bacteroidales bacterium]
MEIKAAQVNELRKMTGVGMMDCKNALVEAEGDFDKAVDILRKKGQKVAAKRADRTADQGRVIAKVNANNTKGYILVLSCETDFVGKNAEFVAASEQFINLAVKADAKTRDEVLALDVDGRTIADHIQDLMGKTGEKIELPAYNVIEAPYVTAYNHMGNRLATIAGFNMTGVDETAHEVALQIASMNPMALSADSISDEVKARELAVYIEKTKAEEIEKYVENAIRKAGINPAHVDSEDHIESNTAKGWITPEQAQQAREIKAAATAEATTNLEKQAKKIEMISQGRLNKFFKENTLLAQDYYGEGKMSVEEFMKKTNKDLTCTGFFRFQLG